MEPIVQLNSNAKLSEHFKLGEFTKSSSHPEVYNIPSHEAIANLKRVCGWLEVLRKRYNERYNACHLEHHPSVMSSGVETSPKGDHEISPRAALGRDDREGGAFRAYPPRLSVRAKTRKLCGLAACDFGRIHEMSPRAALGRHDNGGGEARDEKGCEGWEPQK